MRGGSLAKEAESITSRSASGRSRRVRRVAPPPEELTPMARVFKRLMKQRNVSQAIVADKTGIDKNTLSALMHGRPSHMRTLFKLAEYFHVPPYVFLCDDPAMLTVTPAPAMDLRQT